MMMTGGLAQRYHASPRGQRGCNSRCRDGERTISAKSAPRVEAVSGRDGHRQPTSWETPRRATRPASRSARVNETYSPTEDRLPKAELQRLSAGIWNLWERRMWKQKRAARYLEEKESFVAPTLGLPYLAPRARFRRAARQVKMLCAVQLSLNRYASEAGKGQFEATLPELVTRISVLPSISYMLDSTEKVVFNCSEFKSNYEFKWPEHGKRAVDKQPEDRTDADIQLINGLMRGLHSFRKYTRAHQHMICKIIRLQKYGRRRVVVRKGHLGYAFYFIFSGAVCVTLDEDEESAFVKKEVTILRKGTCFGEIALLKNVRRKATIVCLKETEFLVVDRDDFFKKGLHQHIRAEFKYKSDFFSGLDLFLDWPNEYLEEVSDMARIEEYNHDSVIVKDSRDNHWLLFVTKGRCDVLKLVDIAKVYAAKQKEVNNARGRKRNEEGTPLVLGAGYPLSLLPEGHARRFPWLVPHNLQVPNQRPNTTGQLWDRPNNESAAEPRSQSADVRGSEGTPWHPDYLPVHEDRLTADADSLYTRSSVATCLSKPSCSGSAGPCSPQTLPSHILSGVATMKGNGVDAGVYIKVDSLGPGQCFGLDGVQNLEVQDDRPRYSLLSLGCEIVRVSMSKFREYASEKTLEKVNVLLSNYPSDRELWRSFQKQNRWSNFKNGLVQGIIDQRQSNSFTAKDLRSAAVGCAGSRDAGRGTSLRRSPVRTAWANDRQSPTSKCRDGVDSRSRNHRDNHQETGRTSHMLSS